MVPRFFVLLKSGFSLIFSLMKLPVRNRLDKLLHALCAILLHLRRHMSVNIQRESRSGMAEIFLPYRPNGFYKASLFCGITAMASAATKTVSKNAGRIFLPFRLHTILPAFAVLFNSDDRSFFREGTF